MDTCIIGVRKNGERFINYNYLDTNIPEDTEVVTVRTIEPTLMQRIKESTMDEVQKILAKYL